MSVRYQLVDRMVTTTSGEVGSSTCRMTYNSDSDYDQDNGGVSTYHANNGM